MALTDPIADTLTSNISTIVSSVVPENIFAALSDDQALKVLMFAIIFGVSLRLVKTQSTEALFDTLDSLYRTFNLVIHGLTYLLPFGPCSLLAYQLSRVGADVLFSMVNFVGVAIAFNSPTAFTRWI